MSSMEVHHGSISVQVPYYCNQHYSCYFGKSVNFNAEIKGHFEHCSMESFLVVNYIYTNNIVRP